MKTVSLDEGKAVYKTQHLKRWTWPSDYIGTSWENYYVFLSQTRDSDALERSNFIQGLDAIGGETCEADTVFQPMVIIARAHHWLCGWVETIYIHKDAHVALKIADNITYALKDYPVVDETHFCELEQEDAEEVWQSCYSPKERLAYYRTHQHDWYSTFKELLSSVRTGNRFYGYASDLVG